MTKHCSPSWPRSRTARVAVAVVASALAAQSGARAALPDWPATPYRYLVVDQDLRQVLQEFGRNLGTRVVLSDAVAGRVRGPLPEAPPVAFLDTLARTYGLDWYYDGAVLSVSAVAEATTRFVDLHGMPFVQVADGLSRSGLSDARFVLRQGPAPGVALVAGPPRFVQLLGDAISAMAADRPQPAPPPAGPGAARPAAEVTVLRGASATRVVFQ